MGKNYILWGGWHELWPAGLWKAGVFQQWLDTAEKVTLEVEEKGTDKDEEFATSIFSNPDAYTKIYKVCTHPNRFSLLIRHCLYVSIFLLSFLNLKGW